MRSPHTVRVATDKCTIVRPQDPNICIEFYSHGEFVQARCYFTNQASLIGERILEWIATGNLVDKN